MDTVFAPSHEWLDPKLQSRQVKLDAQDLADQFVAAVEYSQRLPGVWAGKLGYDEADLVSTINMATGEQTVVRYEDFTEVRDYAIAQWRVLSEIIQIVEHHTEMTDPFGRILDLVRGADQFSKGFQEMRLNMPDVLANNS